MTQTLQTIDTFKLHFGFSYEADWNSSISNEIPANQKPSTNFEGKMSPAGVLPASRKNRSLTFENFTR
jgi:hypothetical protein